MQISNHNSTSFGRIYIKEDALTQDQYFDSLDFAEDLTKSRIYQKAHEKGIDIFISNDQNENPRVLFLEDENGQFFFANKSRKPMQSILSRRSVEEKLSNLLDPEFKSRTAKLPNSQVVTVPILDREYYNAEPSEENPEHIWLT